MSEIVSPVNQSVDMATAYQDVMRNLQDGNTGRDLIDSEKLKTSLAVKGAMVAQQHAFDAQLLQHFHEHMKAMSQIHVEDIEKVDQSLAELSSKVNGIARVEPASPAPVPPVQDGHMDPQMVAAVIELQQFAQQIKDAGGIDNIASISAAIQAAGGVQQFNAQLAQVNALSSAAGGPQQLASHFQVVSQVARSAGGVSQLADILQQVKELCLACNGPAECGNMLQAAQDIVSAAGGASQFVDLLKQMKGLLDSANGPISLAELLARMASLCDSCGGNDNLASLLNATSDLTAAFGGAANAQEVMSKLSALVESFGGKDALVGIMRSLTELLDRLGGVDGLYELLARHKELLDRTADLESLHSQLEELSRRTGGLSPEDQQLLRDMEKRVEQLEKEVNGFNNTIEELRAAGRVEAMEDLMSSLMANLKESEKGKQTAMAEAKAARQEARKIRSMKQESLASATSMPATLSSLGSTREYFMARAASGTDKTPQQEPETAVPPLEEPLAASPSRSQLGTSDLQNGGKAGPHLVSALAPASSRGAGKAAKSQRFAPDSMAGESAVPEALNGATAPDDASGPVHVPAAQHSEGAASVPSSNDAADTAGPGAHPTRSTGALVQEARMHVESTLMSPIGSSASQCGGGGPSEAERGSDSASAATVKAANAQDGRASTPGMSRMAAMDTGVSGAAAGSEPQHRPAEAASRASGLFGKFKAKATEIVQEQRLGNVKRFASQALVDTMAKVEQPVAEVLKQLTSIQPAVHMGPDQDDIDALQDELLAHTVRINDLDALVARLDEVKANKDAIKRLYSILEEVWNAVQQIQGPEGDEARGVKQVHGKCISCDRPLNMQRQNRLGDLPSSMDAFSTHKSRPKGPGWESAPNRALGNGDVETAAELRRRAKSPPRGTQDGGLPAHYQPPEQKRPSTTPAFAERPTRHAPGASGLHHPGASVTVAERRRAAAALPSAAPGSTSGAADRRQAGSVSPAPPSAPPSYSVTKNLGKAREKQLEQLKASGEMTFKSERIGDSATHALRR